MISRPDTRSRRTRCAGLLFSGLLFVLTPCGLAQDPPPATEKPEGQKKAKIWREELNDYYRKWLEEDVAYIITAQEYDVFKSLTNDDERDNFIEQFWLRRDEDPNTFENQYKIEHYRRISYANERYTAGIIGWKTDRGRVYITFGPPDRMESMPAGGSYERPRKEGGGSTSVYPFETWEYRHIEGIGDDIVLEFVDDRGGGLYELTFDNQRKDELLKSGFMGPTLDEIEDFELTGSRLKQDRSIGRRYAGELGGVYRSTAGFETARDLPFEKLVLSANLNRAPEIKFKDLEGIVNSNVYYNLIPFQVDTASIRVSSTQSLVTVTVNVPHSFLTFRDRGGMMSTQAQVLGQVTNISKKVEWVFEQDLAQDFSLPEYSRRADGYSVFQKQFLLRPGVYKMNVVVKDVETGNLGTWEGRLENLQFEDDKLSLSSVILAQEISAVDEANLDQFQIGRLKVVPRVTRSFLPGEQLGFYFQIYHSAVDQATQKPDLKVEFAISERGQKLLQWRDCSRLAFFSGTHSTVARLSSLEPYAPGDYELSIRVEDKVSGEEVTQSVPFRIRAEKESRSRR